MYIQDSTLASAFDNAAAEYIEQTEAELLAEYKSISNIANSKKADINLQKIRPQKIITNLSQNFVRTTKKSTKKVTGKNTRVL